MDLFKNKNWSPMLLNEKDHPFDSPDYIFELKFDGIRALIFADKQKIKIQSRNKQDLTFLFPELQNIRKLISKEVAFDGEIIVFEEGKPSFNLIQQRLYLKKDLKIQQAAKTNPVTFIAFDILYEQKNLTDFSLLDRKKFLSKYEDTDYFVKVKMFPKNGIELFKKVKKMNLEGIVAKRKSGKYYINQRTEEFIKIKNILRDEFIIGGYTENKNGTLSVAIGEFINQKFHFVGKIIIGKKNTIYNKIKNQKKAKNYFYDFDESIFYVKPTITCYVQYLERTSNNRLRHPVFKDIKVI